jgi:2-methylcitrate dehydratase PrpD
MSSMSSSSAIFGQSPAAQHATQHVAEFALSVGPQDLSEAVRHEAMRSFVNFIGCALGGSHHESVECAQKALVETAGRATASIIGRAQMHDVLSATLLNCMSASAHGFDDTHAEAVVHPTGPVAAAILALGERDRMRGEDFLAALAVGMEVVCRVSKAFSVLPARANIGWIQTGTAGGIGAAVAAARCLNLDLAQLKAAIGIAASQASGIRGAHGTMCTALIPAHAAQCGLRAAILAAHGFSGSDVAFEGRHGFADVFCDEPNFDALTERLGQSFEILSNTYKAYPCGVVVHPIIDGCLSIRSEHEINPSEIDCVLLTANPITLELAGRRTPKDSIEGHLSIYHWAAAALLLGKAGIAEGSDRCILDPEVIALRNKVGALADAAISRDGAKVTVVLRSGRSFQSDIAHCKGSAGQAMSDADLTKKFRDQATGLLTESQVARLLNLCWKVSTLEDVGEIARNCVSVWRTSDEMLV